MAPHLSLKWRIDVNATVLRTRLDAHGEAILLQLALNPYHIHFISPVTANLSTQHIAKVTSKYQITTYQARVRNWQRAVKCQTGQCWKAGRSIDDDEDLHGVFLKDHEEGDVHDYYQGFGGKNDKRKRRKHNANIKANTAPSRVTRTCLRHSRPTSWDRGV